MPEARRHVWKKGRGKRGILDPLLGTWVAEADSPLGPVRCTRAFSRVMDAKYVSLDVLWEFTEKRFEERAFFGIGEDGLLTFWSFTSDGKQSRGHLVDASDIHPQAVAFGAQMPAGYARQVYWPGDGGTVEWIVESRTAKGWNRFVQHRYRALGTQPA